MWLFAQQAAQMAEQSATSVIRETMLGGIAVGALVLAVWAIRQMKLNQDERIKDRDGFSDKLIQFAEEHRADNAALVNAVDKLTTAYTAGQAENTRVIVANTQALAQHTAVIDGTIREALRRASGGGASTSRFRAVDPPIPRRDDER